MGKNGISCDIMVEKNDNHVKITHEISGDIYNPKVNYTIKPNRKEMSAVGISINPDGLIYKIPDGSYFIKAEVYHDEYSNGKCPIVSEKEKIEVRN